MKKLTSQINKTIDLSIAKLKEHEKDIKSINNNTISIIAILIAEFSIIGFT